MCVCVLTVPPNPSALTVRLALQPVAYVCDVGAIDQDLNSELAVMRVLESKEKIVRGSVYGVRDASKHKPPSVIRERTDSRLQLLNRWRSPVACLQFKVIPNRPVAQVSHQKVSKFFEWCHRAIES
ncbi:MAG TPA: hypothetical protein VK615_05920 [Candidatus Binatia bacterium]|nr:hypothetical protein [Candidatus Binatia bacterium]